MTADQWRTFGSTLRAVHDSALAKRFADRLPAESFSLASAAPVRGVLEFAKRPSLPPPAGERLGVFLREQAGRLEAMVERAEELGERLGGRSFVRVLCHADIHAANLLVADDGRILLVDWDGPMLAPRERDLLFVIGSRIARTVEPHEQAWFFEGYGEVPVDPDAIVYFRYERVLEDLGEIGTSVFSDGDLPEASRESQVALAESFFGPGGILETVERV
jgi:spectinomycin phosphotransferase